jgi:hypothetical protein
MGSYPGVSMKYVFLSEDKLAALRKADPFRRWVSLDDRRVCVLCDKTIMGRQIAITRHSRGIPTLRCPTEGCNGGPHEWVYPGNPLTSKRAWRDWSRIFDEEPELSSAGRLLFPRRATL